eukprot:3579823-Rhodomonas_salina.1
MLKGMCLKATSVPACPRARRNQSCGSTRLVQTVPRQRSIRFDCAILSRRSPLGPRGPGSNFGAGALGLWVSGLWFCGVRVQSAGTRAWREGRGGPRHRKLTCEGKGRQNT